MSALMNFFGENFKKIRTSKELSRYRLAHLADVSEANLGQMENGKRPPPDDILAKLSKVKELGLTYEQLRAWKIISYAAPEELEALKREVEKL